MHKQQTSLLITVNTLLLAYPVFNHGSYNAYMCSHLHLVTLLDSLKLLTFAATSILSSDDIAF